jgi:hypothetical protein
MRAMPSGHVGFGLATALGCGGAATAGFALEALLGGAFSTEGDDLRQAGVINTATTNWRERTARLGAPPERLSVGWGAGKE